MHKKRRIHIPVTLVIACLVIGGFLYLSRGKSYPTFPNPNEPDTAQAAPQATGIQSRLLIGGNIFWGRQFERAVDNDPTLDYNFPFSGLKTLNKKDYNAWIAGLECPVTDADIPFDTQWEAIAFNCRPEYLDAFSKWFDIVTLANNHTDNVDGAQGFAETRKNLESVKVQYFGHYDPNELKDICEVVSLPATLKLSDNTNEEITIPVAMCGYHGVFQSFTDEQLAVIKEYSKHFITLSFAQAGQEYQPASDELREGWYRTMIDNGADAVLGDHPHWVQNTEAYKGKLIVYSQGNYIFDQEFNEEVRRSLLIDMKITIEPSEDLTKLKELGSKCASFHDDCLKTAESTGVAKPKIKLEYNAIGTTTTDLVTRKADKAANNAILQRAAWEQTKAGLIQ